jgi:Tfp pilus assembly protein PilF
MSGAANAEAARRLGLAHALRVQGRLAEARAGLVALLREIPAAAGPAQHLLALVERRAGNGAAAGAAFDRALKLLPTDADLHNNHGNFLDSQGKAAEAIAAYERALRLRPAFADAAINLGIVALAAGDRHRALSALERGLKLAPDHARGLSAYGQALRACGRLDEAAAVLTRALALQPGNARALSARALVAAERAEPDAAARMVAARAASPADRELLIPDAALRVADGMPEPLAALAAAAAAEPDWIGGQVALARLAHETGAGDAAFAGLERLVAMQPQRVEVWAAFLGTVGAARPPAVMREWAERALAAAGPDPRLLALWAEYCVRAGSAADAISFLEAVERSGVAAERAEAEARIGARIALATGAPERALALIDRTHSEVPGLRWHMGLWAFTETAARLADPARHCWLTGHEGLWGVRPVGLDAAELSDLVVLLRRIHVRRAHPLDQSLRQGTQTEGNLFDRVEPLLRQLRDALRQAVLAHAGGLGPVLSGHPTLDPQFATGDIRFSGSWSVRLGDAGFHVAHFHPEGWLSSAFYLVLPEAAPGEGDLVLGEPPADLGTGLGPLAVIRPAPGALALFPSWLWHGTRPFAAGERLTVAFDVVRSA